MTCFRYYDILAKTRSRMMTDTIAFSSQNRDLTKLRRRRRRQKAIGLVSKTTTLHVHHAFSYIFLPSLHDHDVKWPNFKDFWWREWQGYKFDHLCLNSGAAPSLQLQLNLFNFRTMLWAHYNSCSLIIRQPLLDKIPMKVKFLMYADCSCSIRQRQLKRTSISVFFAVCTLNINKLTALFVCLFFLQRSLLASGRMTPLNFACICTSPFFHRIISYFMSKSDDQLSSESSLKTTIVRSHLKILLICLSTSLFFSRLAQVYTASSQIIKRIILRHLEHPVSTLTQLSLFRIVNPGLFSIKSTLSKTETSGTSTSCPS